MRQSINKWSKFNQLLFGQRCLLCATSHREPFGLCQACDRELPRLSAAHCPQCALPSPHSGDPAIAQLCGHCLQSPPAFDRARALFSYEHPVDAMLQRYKYQHKLHMAEHFAGRIAQALTAPAHPMPALPDLMIPMPLHPKRLSERGYNQSLEIARQLHKTLAVPLDATSCTRTRLTPPQASLPLKARVKNMKDAFACNRRLDGLRIALIDDVMTTGASLNALAKTIKVAGAVHVECWVIARTLPG